MSFQLNLLQFDFTHQLTSLDKTYKKRNLPHVLAERKVIARKPGLILQ